MPQRPNRIRYRSNGVIQGKPFLGRKVEDEVTGFWTYEQYLTTNAFGERVDARGDGLDNPVDFPIINKGG